MIVRGTTVIAGGTRIRIRDHDPQVAGIGVPGGGDPACHAALHAAATKPDLHGDHAGQAAARADRAEESSGHRGPQRPTAAAVFGIARQPEERWADGVGWRRLPVTGTSSDGLS